MNKKKKNRKLLNLWLSPLLVGSFFATGYSLTRKLEIFKTRETKVFWDSFTIQRVFPGKGLDSFKKELKNEKDPQLIKDPTSPKTLESLIDKNQTQAIDSEESIETTKENLKYSKDLKNGKILGRNSNQSLQSLPIETQLFFKKHNIDEVIKKLPLP